MRQSPEDIKDLPFKVFKRLHVFSEITSTNEYLKTKGLSAGTVAIAQVQTKGRGKHGAVWDSQAGGLWFSYLMKKKLSDPYYYVIVSSVAVCRALEKYSLKPVIKWPNDILLGRKKVCGMLIEKDGYSRTIVTGIGINVNNKVPAGLGAISLKKAGIKTSPGRLVVEILQELDLLLCSADKREAVREWIKRQKSLTGRKINVLKNGIKKEYVVQGVMDTGKLKVISADKRTKTLNGEVFFF